ncbi:MAG: hypothetical protein COA36_17615 [Desulfotalea sp.]|nr:MAG: hypothetical protein COA36_17615 [Desulfotalea sp.]
MYWNVVSIEVVGHCNGTCSYCPQGTGDAVNDGVISLRTFKKALGMAKEGRSKALLLHARGEPLLHPKLPELIYIARSSGFLVYLSTNLLCATDEKIKAVMLAGINQIEIHYDAALSQFSENEIAQKIWYIHCCNEKNRNNACRIEINHAQKEKEEQFVIQKRFSQLPPSLDKRMYTPYDWHTFIESNEVINERPNNCYWYLHKACVIQSNGDIVICCLDHFKYSKVKNIHEISIIDESCCLNRDMCKKCSASNWGRDWIEKDMFSLDEHRKKLLEKDVVVF